MPEEITKANILVVEDETEHADVMCEALTRLGHKCDVTYALEEARAKLARRKYDVVVTVNSKSGAEGLLLGRPVFVLGDAFYAPCDLVRRIDALGDLPGALGEALASPPLPEVSAVRRYFQDVWDASWPGELYAVSNAGVLGASLLAYLERGAQ